MLRSFARIVVMALAFTVPLACGGDKTTAPVSAVSGTWAGTITAPEGDFTLSADLQHTIGDTAVSGSATISAGGGSIPLAVVGGYNEPAISLTFSAPDIFPMTYTATVSGGHMTGILDGSGFDSVAVTLTRK
jgi:hypothetical protein